MSTAFHDDIKAEERVSRLDTEPLEPSQLREKTKDANEEISRAMGFGDFIISAQAVAELRRLRRGLAKQHESYVYYLIESADAINNCLVHIRRIARDDLTGGAGSFIRRARRILTRDKTVTKNQTLRFGLLKYKIAGSAACAPAQKVRKTTIHCRNPTQPQIAAA
jgi:hypothetical protein